MKRFAAMAAGVLLVLGGCGDGDDGGPEATGGVTTTADAGPQEFTVKVDGESDKFNGEFAAFFPSKLQARPGDKVTFALERFSGAPHTATFGTLVDSALMKFRQLPPTATVAATENFPEMGKLTDLFPHKAPPGPPSPNQSAAQPCFLKTGEPPSSLTGGAPACAKVEQPAFDGTYTFYNSGALMEDGDTFSLELDETIEPGSYSFICLVHRGPMSGDLTVVDAGASVPSPDEVEEAGEAEFQQLVAVGEEPAKAAAAATPDKAFAGTGDPTNPALIVAEFGPKSVSIPVGGTASWSVFAFHSVTLNAKDSDVVLVQRAPDGSVQFPPSLAPVGFKAPPTAGDFPPADDEKPMVIDGGQWDGAGLRSTGLLGSLPPRFITVKQTFTKAGTYILRCVVHPDMKGEVKVG